MDDTLSLRQGLNNVLRSALSYQVKNRQSEEKPPLITTYVIADLKKSSFVLPSPSVQAVNILRYIGDYIRENGKKIDEFPVDLCARVGAISPDDAEEIANELRSAGLVSGVLAGSSDQPYGMVQIGLTLQGWEAYEKEVKGRFTGNYGFMALKFNDPILDEFLSATIKPAVVELGYELLDMRDSSRAGIIDNLMRTQIRDSAFVLADLTHENPGAYWEAGYAEGLGKPVLYLCSKEKFDLSRTHFDTNHSTTVLWNVDDPKRFVEEFQATLRRSLNLFDA